MVFQNWGGGGWWWKEFIKKTVDKNACKITQHAKLPTRGVQYVMKTAQYIPVLNVNTS